MIFLVQFGINEHSLIFSKNTILLVFEKNLSCLFVPNCTRNHVITSTKLHSIQFNYPLIIYILKSQNSAAQIQDLFVCLNILLI